nr:hypothetical protein [Pseudonocardia acidicola]
MVACGFLSAWQWHRAGSAMGSAVNVGYALQWPLFAVFFGFMWWRFLRLEIRRLTGLDTDEIAEPPATPTAGADVAPATTPSSGFAADDELPAPRVADPVSSPFGVRRTPVAPVTDDEDPQLAAYNRMLARLAARDQENSA